MVDETYYAIFAAIVSFIACLIMFGTSAMHRSSSKETLARYIPLYIERLEVGPTIHNKTGLFVSGDGWLLEITGNWLVERWVTSPRTNSFLQARSIVQFQMNYDSTWFLLDNGFAIRVKRGWSRVGNTSWELKVQGKTVSACM